MVLFKGVKRSVWLDVLGLVGGGSFVGDLDAWSCVHSLQPCGQPREGWAGTTDQASGGTGTEIVQDGEEEKICPGEFGS